MCSLGVEFWEAESPGVMESDSRQNHPAPTQRPETHVIPLTGDMALGPGLGRLCRSTTASELGVRGGQEEDVQGELGMQSQEKGVEGERRGQALAVALWSEAGAVSD